jgi:hypothetical protein
MKLIKSIVETIIFLLGGKGDIRKEAEQDGICYYGGQQ